MSGVWARARWADAWPCLPFLAVGLIGTEPAATYQPDAARPLDPAAYTLIVIAALALAGRRRPGTALAVNGAAVAAYLAAGYPYGPILLTVPAAVYGVGVAWPAGRAMAVVAADVGVLVVALFAKAVAEGEDSVTVLPQVAIAMAALVAGMVVRIRREAAAGMRTEQARRAASEERLRMAQDLHDTIGHGLAAIAMQAGVALHVLDRDVAEARRAMEAVRATSRESLDNLRAGLERLRGDEPARRGPAPPGPGLDGLGELADRVRAAGVELTVDVQPDLGLAGPVEAAAFRIVREALTNVLRHAGAATTLVLVRRDDADLLVEITDTGAGTGTAAEGGLGIRGMRAQAEQLGGTLEVGPLPAGGFSVRARIPVEARA
ncbi:sensor histidine kinase [Nonomuraea cavernae]|uniref:sensor histidine kinase n=1 Tax=Nonomuraea cavernae TaxID=2045107 RepID=UPI00166717E0|nr:sensor histidine kinase [Nonomuraea cavernae]MCA2189196.1 sensor histidine kinase [Nonomuraea cavernae]